MAVSVKAQTADYVGPGLSPVGQTYVYAYSVFSYKPVLGGTTCTNILNLGMVSEILA
jgi:hypothetical protein